MTKDPYKGKIVFTRVYEINCGSPGCPNEDQYASEGLTRKYATTRWEFAGWRRIGGKWLCPECAREVK